MFNFLNNRKRNMKISFILLLLLFAYLLYQIFPRVYSYYVGGKRALRHDNISVPFEKLSLNCSKTYDIEPMFPTVQPIFFKFQFLL